MGTLVKYANSNEVEEALDKGVQGYDKAVENETDISTVSEDLSTINSIVGITWIDSKFISATGTQQAADGKRKCTDYIVCNENTNITYVAETNHQNVCGISFYDADFKFISGEVNVGDAGTEITTVSPVGTYYCRLSTKSPTEAKIKFEKSQLADTVRKLSDRIKDNNASVNLENAILDDRIASGIYTSLDPKFQSNQSGCTFNADGSFTISAGGYYFPIYASPLQMKGDCIVRIKGSGIGHINIARSETGSSGVTPYVTTEANGGYEQAIISKEAWGEQYPYIQIRIDNRTSSEEITIHEIIVGDTFLKFSSYEKKTEIAYVSPDGSDNNVGTTSSPYATVNKALENGAKVVGVYGGRYRQTIDLSKTTSPSVEIRCMQDTKRVIFESPDCVLGTSESLVSGYTKVYQIETTVSIADGNKWIYQDGVADETTLISDAERHPLERGYTYRCEDTKIVRCTSTTVDDAISEIESSDIYKWYLDSDNGVLYFSRPQAITTDNPLCYSSGTNLFANLSRKLSLKLVGIETKYLVFNTMLVSSAEVLDCKAANVYGAGAFRYDRCQSAMFVRCEAVRCQAGDNGDGFNGHSLSTGDIHSKQTNVTLFDCYSHDNKDDGYSDHERSEITIIGGLYEYNGKAGVTPSYGSHCTCHNVYSRNNNNGFLYTGDATEAEGGKYGQMVCHNCVAENNRVGGTKAGFIVNGTGNTMMLVGCKSINNKYGYYVGSDTASATLIDCTGLDNDVIKFGNNVTIKNTAVVTE